MALVQVENDCCTWAAWAVERSADGALVMAAHSKGEGIATQRSRERRVRCRPTHVQLDPTVDAAAEHGRRQRSVKHHVSDGDQVVRHARSLNYLRM